MVEPRFDELLTFTVTEGDGRSWMGGLICHKNADGNIYAAHTPLDKGPVHCDLCYDPSTRVYITVPE